MPAYRCEIWTGPIAVKQISRRLKRAKLRVVSTGTEKIHVDVKASDSDAARSKVVDAFHQKFKARFRHPLGCWKRSS